MEYMRQRKLRNGNNYTVGWIDDQLAVLGKRVSFEKIGDDIIWLVHEVYSRLPAEFVEDHARDYVDFAKKLAVKNDRGKP